jgi:hypothetical protein
MSQESDDVKKSRSDAMPANPSHKIGAPLDVTEDECGDETDERAPGSERDVDEDDEEEAQSSPASERLLATSESAQLLDSTADVFATTLRSRNGHFRIPSFLRVKIKEQFSQDFHFVSLISKHKSFTCRLSLLQLHRCPEQTKEMVSCWIRIP